MRQVCKASGAMNEKASHTGHVRVSVRHCGYCSPLSLGESGPAHCFLCGGTTRNPAADESGPRPLEAV